MRAVGARVCLLLAATPLANRLHEYYEMASLAQPPIFGMPADFDADFGTSIALGNSADAPTASARRTALRLRSSAGTVPVGARH